MSSLTDEQARLLRWDWRFWARPKQLPPPGDWRIWLLLAGRGFGKTRTINEWARTQALEMPGSRGAIVAATAADARDVVVEGESGIVNIGPPETCPVYEPSKRRVTWANGSVATLFSADEPSRLRGPQFHWAIADELAHWRYIEAWDMLLMGLRLGDNPRCAVATTPRPIPIIKALLEDPTAAVTRGSTYENRANLAAAFFAQVVSRYEGTTLGRQELNAEVLEDREGALWKRAAMIDAHRVTEIPPLTRIVIGVDPPGGATECGIVVAGVARLSGLTHGYVLDDRSLKASPNEWATEVVTAYHRNEADRVIGETNYGGDMVENTIRTVNPSVAYRAVHASRGKAIRAEPAASLYEQGRVHHVGQFPHLEDEMCSWVPGEGMPSPNRLDALVWALTDLMLGEREYKPMGAYRYA